MSEEDYAIRGARDLSGALGCPAAVAQLVMDWHSRRDRWKAEAMAARELLDRVGWGYASRLGECAAYRDARNANGEE